MEENSADSLRSPLRDFTNQLTSTPSGASGSKTDRKTDLISSPQIGHQERSINKENRELETGDKGDSCSKEAVDRRGPDLDVESDATCEYESAGDSSPRPLSLSALADSLARVHLSTPTTASGPVVPLTSFPFSPISDEDVSLSGEEVLKSPVARKDLSLLLHEITLTGDDSAAPTSKAEERTIQAATSGTADEKSDAKRSSFVTALGLIDKNSLDVTSHDEDVNLEKTISIYPNLSLDLNDSKLSSLDVSSNSLEEYQSCSSDNTLPFESSFVEGSNTIIDGFNYVNSLGSTNEREANPDGDSKQTIVEDLPESIEKKLAAPSCETSSELHTKQPASETSTSSVAICSNNSASISSSGSLKSTDASGVVSSKEFHRSNATPSIVNESVSPRFVEENITPSNINECVIPRIVEECITPSMVNESVTPSIVEENISSSIINECVTPQIGEESISSSVVNEIVTPSIVDENITPSIVEENMTPGIVNECVTPRIVEENVTSSMVIENVIISIVEENITPSIVNKCVTPRIVEENVTSSMVNENVITSIVEESGILNIVQGRITPCNLEKPSIGEESITSSVVNEIVSPSIVDENISPNIVNESVSISVIDKSIAPSIVKESTTSSIVNEIVSPSIVDENISPNIVKGSVSLSVIDENIAPSIVKETLSIVGKNVIPNVMEENSAPCIVESITPSIVKESIIPSIVNENITPSVISESITPSIVNESVTPSILEDSVTPSECATANIAKRSVTPCNLEESIRASIDGQSESSCGIVGEGDSSEKIFLELCETSLSELHISDSASESSLVVEYSSNVVSENGISANFQTSENSNRASTDDISNEELKKSISGDNSLRMICGVESNDNVKFSEKDEVSLSHLQPASETSSFVVECSSNAVSDSDLSSQMSTSESVKSASIDEVVPRKELKRREEENSPTEFHSTHATSESSFSVECRTNITTSDSLEGAGIDEVVTDEELKESIVEENVIPNVVRSSEDKNLTEKYESVPHALSETSLVECSSYVPGDSSISLNILNNGSLKCANIDEFTDEELKKNLPPTENSKLCDSNLEELAPERLSSVVGVVDVKPLDLLSPHHKRRQSWSLVEGDIEGSPNKRIALDREVPALDKTEHNTAETDVQTLELNSNLCEDSLEYSQGEIIPAILEKMSKEDNVNSLTLEKRIAEVPQQEVDDEDFACKAPEASALFNKSFPNAVECKETSESVSAEVIFDSKLKEPEDLSEELVEVQETVIKSSNESLNGIYCCTSFDKSTSPLKSQGTIKESESILEENCLNSEKPISDLKTIVEVNENKIGTHLNDIVELKLKDVQGEVEKCSDIVEKSQDILKVENTSANICVKFDHSITPLGSIESAEHKEVHEVHSSQIEEENGKLPLATEIRFGNVPNDETTKGDHNGTEVDGEVLHTESTEIETNDPMDVSRQMESTELANQIPVGQVCGSPENGARQMVGICPNVDPIQQSAGITEFNDVNNLSIEEFQVDESESNEDGNAMKKNSAVEEVIKKTDVELSDSEKKVISGDVFSACKEEVGSMEQLPNHILEQIKTFMFNNELQQFGGSSTLLENEIVSSNAQVVPEYILNLVKSVLSSKENVETSQGIISSSLQEVDSLLKEIVIDAAPIPVVDISKEDPIASEQLSEVQPDYTENIKMTNGDNEMVCAPTELNSGSEKEVSGNLCEKLSMLAVDDKLKAAVKVPCVSADDKLLNVFNIPEKKAGKDVLNKLEAIREYDLEPSPVKEELRSVDVQGPSTPGTASPVLIRNTSIMSTSSTSEIDSKCLDNLASLESSTARVNLTDDSLLISKSVSSSNFITENISMGSSPVDPFSPAPCGKTQESKTKKSSLSSSSRSGNNNSLMNVLDKSNVKNTSKMDNLQNSINKLDDLSKLNDQRKSYEDLLDRCSEQERLLGFDDSLKDEADKLIRELANSRTEGDIEETATPTLPSSAYQGDAFLNRSEAGPITADQDLNRQDCVFQDASTFDFDFLSRVGSKTFSRNLERESLFVKFDPLVGKLTPKSNKMRQPDSDNSGSRGMARTGGPTGEEKLVCLSPAPASDTASSSTITPPRSATSKGRPSSGTTPTLRHEILSKEISKLQDLMLQQESSYQEQILARTEEVEELRALVAQLETKKEQEGDEEDREMLEERVRRLERELAECVEAKRQLSIVVQEYEKTCLQIIASREEDKRRFELEKGQIGKERDEAMQHLTNMEIAFNDIHQKYEKCKDVIEAFKQNEEEYKRCTLRNNETIRTQEENFRKLKQHATQKLEQAKTEITEMRKAHEGDLAKMKAMQRKMEVSCKSLEESLQQKTREAEELSKICDELIKKVECTKWNGR